MQLITAVPLSGDFSPEQHSAAWALLEDLERLRLGVTPVPVKRCFYENIQQNYEIPYQLIIIKNLVKKKKKKNCKNLNQLQFCKLNYKL